MKKVVERDELLQLMVSMNVLCYKSRFNYLDLKGIIQQYHIDE